MSAYANSIQIVLLRTMKEQKKKRWDTVSKRKKEINKFQNNKTGLQPVSRSVEQILGFSKRFKKLPKWDPYHGKRYKKWQKM